MTLVHSIAFFAIFALHATAGLIYLRGVLHKAGPVCRLVFVAQELLLFAIGVLAFHEMPEVVILLGAYVTAVIYSRHRAFRLSSPASPPGAARLLKRAP